VSYQLGQICFQRLIFEPIPLAVIVVAQGSKTQIFGFCRPTIDFKAEETAELSGRRQTVKIRPILLSRI
jgi:hypothetical protein